MNLIFRLAFSLALPCLASCKTVSDWGSRAQKFGEHSYAVEPFKLEIAKKYGPEAEDSNPHNNGNQYALIAYQLKNESDRICNKFKIDLALSQTGTNFLSDISNVLLGAVGGAVGGVTAQITSAGTGAVTGYKNVVSSDIYGKVTDIVSNYIDTSRDEQWLTVQNKLKSTPGYQNDAEVFNDLQIYHSRCSLIRAIATAAKESGNKKVDTDGAVAKNDMIAGMIDPTTLKLISGSSQSKKNKESK